MSEWNRKNPERVREAQRRYAERHKARRAGLSQLDKAREDLVRVFSSLSLADRTRLLEWARVWLLDDE